VKDLLTNCNYKGYVRYAVDDEERYFEVKGQHEPIISEELYDEVQELIRNMSVKIYKKHPKEDSYFSGILVCSLCGSKLLSHMEYRKGGNGNDILQGGNGSNNTFIGRKLSAFV